MKKLIELKNVSKVFKQPDSEIRTLSEAIKMAASLFGFNIWIMIRKLKKI